MSYSIQISGHTDGPHNELVRRVAEEAVAKLRVLAHLDGPNLSGSSSDTEGSITLETPEPGQEQAAPDAGATAPAGRPALPVGPGKTGDATGTADEAAQSGAAAGAAAGGADPEAAAATPRPAAAVGPGGTGDATGQENPDEEAGAEA